MKKTKVLHIFIIIVGIIFILIPSIHMNLWFDESYSVGIVNKNFLDIWKITGNDVHPALYYWLLHIVYLIFGSNIIVYRLFSVLAIVILGIIGYTHIRKDFGEKVGILFSFFTYFLPAMSTYAGEIRMYSWSCLIVTLMAIYAYRFYKSILNKDEKLKNKNLILFGIFSICSCYIHYYALVTACLINLILLIYVIRNKKEDKKTLIQFLILAGIQILLYIPWLVYLVGQLKHVGGGFWIEVAPVRTTVEVLGFQFRRMLDVNFSFTPDATISFIASIFMYSYIGYKIYKLRKEEIKPAFLSLGVYFGVIGIMAVLSIITPILYSRYLIVITGIYIFLVAFIISKEKNKIVTGIIIGAVLILSAGCTAKSVQVNYNYSNSKKIESANSELYEYMNNNIQADDILIYSNIGNGGVIAAYFPQYKQYFLNFDHWDVEEAYKAYGPGMKTVSDWSFLENYTGRIWLIDSENLGLYEMLPKENIEVLKEPKTIDTKYHDYVFNIILVEKR